MLPIRPLTALCAGLLLALPPLAMADEMTLLATMGSKAIFQLNGQKKTLQIGQTVGGIKVISIAADSAVIEASNGRQRRLGLGEGYVISAATPSDGDSSVVLSPSQGGHYLAEVAINGQSQTGVIDTGATHLSMSANVANQLKLNYQNGQPMRSHTANGVIRSWLIVLPKARIGNVTLYNLDLVVRDSNDNSPILIGMSTLNRFQMKREQELMILSKKAY
ncbi:TIGR02281 family clan AA aspartic protease [uncultured Deefgea sp.]|uniref:retropepsin-like aspartic protease family protein n=1 Tax=uncultured Deefgea sp. TaxID=1304914 RepID=UPI00260BF951|nr:retropepsin-like aspartic protease [uncultured Deefgea sp.]